MADLTPEERLPRASLLKIPGQRRSIHVVHEILDAAIKVLATQGNEGFTSQSIAERAGVSVGSLYQYFANKEMIGAAIVERAVLDTERLLSRQVRAMARRPFEEALLAAILGATRLAEPYRQAVREILRVTPLLSETAVPALVRRPFLLIATEYFAANAHRYEIVGGYTTLTVLMDTLIFMTLRRWADRDPQLSDEEFYGTLVRMVGSQVAEKKSP
ncbi:MAG: TetR/AcrR family transcriptional regulator [Bdellovibrionota bacterium]